MALSRIVNNIGVGKVEAVFANVSTTIAAGDAIYMTEADFNNNKRVVSHVGLNQVALNSTTAPIHGVVLAYSEDNFTDKSHPAVLTVQIQGVALAEGTTTLPVATLANNAAIRQISGKVSYITGHATTMRVQGQTARVLNVFNTDQLELLLS
jgi:hypothetical protein